MTENVKEITHTLGSETLSELKRCILQASPFLVSITGFDLQTLDTQNEDRKVFEKRQRQRSNDALNKVISNAGVSLVELEVGLKRIQKLEVIDPNCFKPVDLALKTHCMNPAKRHAPSPPARDRVAPSRNVQKPKPKNRAKAKMARRARKVNKK